MSSKKKPSKTDFERVLTDLPQEQIPEKAKALYHKYKFTGGRSTRLFPKTYFGYWLRSNYLPLFNDLYQDHLKSRAETSCVP